MVVVINIIKVTILRIIIKITIIVLDHKQKYVIFVLKNVFALINTQLISNGR